jgi:two-component system response regulator
VVTSRFALNSIVLRSGRIQVTMKWRILLVDDDSNDRQLFALALKKSGLKADLFEATDGFAAINYLLGNKPYDDRSKYPYPDLIFLDLKMPAMDGFGVLKEIRRCMGMQNVPVIVFTNSNSDKDAAAAYYFEASAFHQKPFKLDDLVSLLQTVIPLWRFPSASRSDFFPTKN